MISMVKMLLRKEWVAVAVAMTHLIYSHPSLVEVDFLVWFLVCYFNFNLED